MPLEEEQDDVEVLDLEPDPDDDVEVLDLEPDPDDVEDNLAVKSDPEGSKITRMPLCEDSDVNARAKLGPLPRRGEDTVKTGLNSWQPNFKPPFSLKNTG